MDATPLFPRWTVAPWLQTLRFQFPKQWAYPFPSSSSCMVVGGCIFTFYPCSRHRQRTTILVSLGIFGRGRRQTHSHPQTSQTLGQANVPTPGVECPLQKKSFSEAAKGDRSNSAPKPRPSFIIIIEHSEETPYVKVIEYIFVVLCMPLFIYKLIFRFNGFLALCFWDNSWTEPGLEITLLSSVSNCYFVVFFINSDRLKAFEHGPWFWGIQAFI